MIVGVGVDVVGLERLKETLHLTPGIKDRLFTPNEQGSKIATLAATFAAKEAVAKALGAPAGLDWLDVEVCHDDSGRPYLEVTGTVAAAAQERGVAAWHLSLSHDAGVAVAMVVAEGPA